MSAYLQAKKKKTTTSPCYNLHGQTLEVTDSSKYLGVTIKNDLTWSQHIDASTAKANRTVGFLKRNFSRCSSTAKASTYTSMVRPILEYASTAWDPHLRRDITKIEQVQRRAARYVTNNYSDKTPGSVTKMLDDLGWDTLEERRKRTRLLMLYKMKHNIVDMDLSQSGSG